MIINHKGVKLAYFYSSLVSLISIIRLGTNVKNKVMPGLNFIINKITLYQLDNGYLSGIKSGFSNWVQVSKMKLM